MIMIFFMEEKKSVAQKKNLPCLRCYTKPVENNEKLKDMQQRGGSDETMKVGQFFTGDSIDQPKAGTETREVKVASAPACPICGGKIIEGKKGYGCSNWRPEDGNCLFVIWKEIPGKRLTEKNIQTLLAGKTTRPYVLKDENGNKYSAKLRLVKTNETLFGIEVLPEGNLPMPAFTVPCSRQ
jgi:hypothetical protein